MLSHIKHIIIRDLEQLEKEITLYKKDEDLWKIAPGTTNSVGTLALHLAGNLRHFIGATLGSTGYVRNRDGEFSVRGMTKNEVISLLKFTMDEVAATFDKLPSEVLTTTFPLQKHGEDVTTLHMLLHLLGHLSYHLGQVNYHRRVITAND